jgi:hypothetical protein
LSVPLLTNAFTTAAVMVFSTAGSCVLFLKVGTATVLMCGGRLPRKL